MINLQVFLIVERDEHIGERLRHVRGSRWQRVPRFNRNRQRGFIGVEIDLTDEFLRRRIELQFVDHLLRDFGRAFAGRTSAKGF